MVQCGSLIIWRPIPDTSTFKPKVTLGNPSDTSAFNITVFVTKGDAAAPPLRHDDIVAGKASSVIAKGDQIVYDVVLSIFHKPAKPIALDLGVFDAANKPVKVSDGAGGTRDAECTGTFSDVPSGPIMIKIVALA
jgi:hypothetical protein